MIVASHQLIRMRPPNNLSLDTTMYYYYFYIKPGMDLFHSSYCAYGVRPKIHLTTMKEMTTCTVVHIMIEAIHTFKKIGNPIEFGLSSHILILTT